MTKAADLSDIPNRLPADDAAAARQALGASSADDVDQALGAIGQAIEALQEPASEEAPGLVPLATKEQAEAGDGDAAMTPERVHDALSLFGLVA